MTTEKQQADVNSQKYHLQILTRALSVLFVFSADRAEWTLDELANELDLNKTSLLRIVRTLEAERFLFRRSNTYRLGPRVLDLGNVYLSTLSVHRTARHHMEHLAKTCQQTVSLAILEGLEVVYIAIEQARREVGIQSEIGGRHPAHATALGKVMLAALSEHELCECLEGARLKRLTHRTIVEPEALIEHLQGVREDGHAIDDEERGIGIRCIAAPIYNHTGTVIAGLSLAGPIFHMTDEAVPKYTAELLKATRALSLELGYNGVIDTFDEQRELVDKA